MGRCYEWGHFFLRRAMHLMSRFIQEDLEQSLRGPARENGALSAADHDLHVLFRDRRGWDPSSGAWDSFNIFLLLRRLACTSNKGLIQVVRAVCTSSMHWVQ